MSTRGPWLCTGAGCGSRSISARNRRASPRTARSPACCSRPPRTLGSRTRRSPFRRSPSRLPGRRRSLRPGRRRRFVLRTLVFASSHDLAEEQCLGAVVAELAGRPARQPEQATPIAARALAPDLARGLMLLLIALANAHLFCYGRQLGVRGYPADLAPVDRTVTLLQLMLVDGRAYPLFALLFGYGIVQLARRQQAAGREPTSVVSLVRRRGGWLMLIGFGHAALLFGGDIIGLYGLLAVLLASVLVLGSDRILLALCAAGLAFTALLGVLQALPPPPGTTTVLPSLSETNPLTAVPLRIFE